MPARAYHLKTSSLHLKSTEVTWSMFTNLLSMPTSPTLVQYKKLSSFSHVYSQVHQLISFSCDLCCNSLFIITIFLFKVYIFKIFVSFWLQLTDRAWKKFSLPSISSENSYYLDISTHVRLLNILNRLYIEEHLPSGYQCRTSHIAFTSLFFSLLSGFFFFFFAILYKRITLSLYVWSKIRKWFEKFN